MPSAPEIRGRLWFVVGGGGQVGRGRVELLERIMHTGSLSQAARDMKMSYKSAWDAIQALELACGKSLVEKSVGGRHGGGSKLTEAGRLLIAAFREAEASHRACLARIEERLSRNWRL